MGRQSQNKEVRESRERERESKRDMRVGHTYLLTLHLGVAGLSVLTSFVFLVAAGEQGLTGQGSSASPRSAPQVIEVGGRRAASPGDTPFESNVLMLSRMASRSPFGANLRS